MSPLALASIVIASGASGRPAEGANPTHAYVDLLRPGPGGERVYVQATLPDGVPGLFLVDTGASVSVLSEETALRLGIPIERGYGYVEGLGGRAPFDRAVIPSLTLGDVVVEGVDVAVGVRGVPERAGLVPLDGILGTNVWAQFVMEVDYPRDRLGLHEPGSVRLPRRAAPMAFENGHVFSLMTATAQDRRTDVDLIVQLDTGAGDLLLDGPAPLIDLEGQFTVGVEPIYGIGASEIMPPSEFLVETRRVGLSKVALGGRRFSVDGFQARWVGWERATGLLTDDDAIIGLAGHALFARHVAWFDFAGGRFALQPSHGKRRSLDVHAVVLAQDLDTYGDDPRRGLLRAEIEAALDGTDDAPPGAHLDAALRYLDAFLTVPDLTPDEVAQARTLMAGIHRFRGDLDAAWEAERALDAGQLVATGEIVAAVNGLALAGDPAAALALAERAVEATRDASDNEGKIEQSTALVSRADALFALGRLDDARADLMAAAAAVENPDAHLLRRSRVALAQQDRYGAIALVRRLLQLYPSEGTFLWFYALLVDDPGTASTFEADMEHAMSRLHPPFQPLDFQVAARRALGQQDAALDLMQQGAARDCHDLPQSDSSRDNCIAWYHALAGVDLDDALVRVDRALAKDGRRSDYLDTKAMVHLARGEGALAYEAALDAARLAPDDIYMLWQVERMAARGAGG